MKALLARVWVVAAVMLVAACGGNSATENQPSFNQGLSSALSQLKQTSHSIGIAIEQAPSQSDTQIAATFRKLAARWQTGVNELEKLKPPADLTADFHTLTESSTRAESDLKAIAVAGEAHNGPAAKRSTVTLIRNVLTAKAAATRLTNKRGIH